MGSIIRRESAIRLGVTLIAVLSTVMPVLATHAEGQLKLAVFANPGTIIAWGDETAQIVVQVQDAAGHPVCVSQPVTITLASSTPSVLKPYYREGDERGVIRLGPQRDNPNLGMTRFQPAQSPGTATVTASAPGFASGSVTVTVLRRPERVPPPRSVKLHVQPPVVPTARTDRQRLGSKGEVDAHVVLQTLDAAGNPTGAARRFDVKFTSSDPAVASASSFFYVDVSSFNTTHLNVGEKAGATTLTVAAEGLRGDSVRITTFSCAAGTTVTAGTVQPPPPPLPPRPDVVPPEITLGAGETWERELPASRTLELLARIAYEKVAGANFPLEVWVNGQRVTSPLLNKRPTFGYADGRSFPYYDASVPGWLLFYSQDFTANNTTGGGGYQVMTDPGQAYRYAWDVSSLVGSSATMRVRLVNNGRGVNRPVVVRLQSSPGVTITPSALPAAREVRVFVRDDQGRAVAGTRVRLGAPPCEGEGTTDSSGVATLRVPSGGPCR